MGDCAIIPCNVPITHRGNKMARKENITGHCQICGKKLQPSARKDKMTCEGKSTCSKKWTAFAKKMRGVSWSVPKGLDRLAYGEEFKEARYHQVELALEGWKRLHDSMGEVILEVERGQADRASELGIYHSSQFGFYNFLVAGGKK